MTADNDGSKCMGVSFCDNRIRPTDLLFQDDGPETIGIESGAAQVLLHIYHCRNDPP